MKNIGIVAVLNINYIFSFFAYSIFPVYFPEQAHILDIEAETVGIIMSFYFISYAVVAIQMDGILSKLGRKVSMQFGLAALTICMLGFAFSNFVLDKTLYIILNSIFRLMHGAS